MLMWGGTQVFLFIFFFMVVDFPLLFVPFCYIYMKKIIIITNKKKAMTTEILNLSCIAEGETSAIRIRTNLEKKNKQK